MEKSNPEHQDIFANLKELYVGPNTKIIKKFKQDQSSLKFNLVPGPFSDSVHRIYSFKAAKQAKLEVIKDNRDKDYVPMVGDPAFNLQAQKLIFGESPLITDDKVVTIQTISGSGALRIILQFLKEFSPADVYISNITWDNHKSIPHIVGLPTKIYPYLNTEKMTLAFKEMFHTLETAHPGSIVLLHASAFNPSGIEPSLDQWKALAKLFRERKLIAIFDCAGQGLVSGDLNKDIQSIRSFLEEETQVIVTQSLGNSLGIYGEMVGALHVVCKSKEVKVKVVDQIKVIFRTMYSNPPCTGAWIAAKMLSNQELRSGYENEIKQVAGKFSKIREGFYDLMKEMVPERSWEYIKEHNGPYFYIKLTGKERETLEKDYHIYLSVDGSLSMENINVNELKYITESISQVIKNERAGSMIKSKL